MSRAVPACRSSTYTPWRGKTGAGVVGVGAKPAGDELEDLGELDGVERVEDDGAHGVVSFRGGVGGRGGAGQG